MAEELSFCCVTSGNEHYPRTLLSTRRHHSQTKGGIRTAQSPDIHNISASRKFKDYDENTHPSLLNVFNGSSQALAFDSKKNSTLEVEFRANHDDDDANFDKTQSTINISEPCGHPPAQLPPYKLQPPRSAIVPELTTDPVGVDLLNSASVTVVVPSVEGWTEAELQRFQSLLRVIRLRSGRRTSRGGFKDWMLDVANEVRKTGSHPVRVGPPCWKLEILVRKT
jgi:hypothetical protein